MSAGLDIARIAGLVGEPARAEILLALMAGHALTATELAQTANITKQTASAHLSRMLKAELLRVESQGRHRYFRLAGKDIAQLLEHLLGVAERTRSPAIRIGPRDAGMRKARICYDHLAGDLGVLMFDGLIAQGLLRIRDEVVEVTRAGQHHFGERGLDIDAMQGQRRSVCRRCLDWSVRRHHLAGSLGAALLTEVLRSNWARHSRGSRLITFTIQGESLFRQRYRS
ncbi:MAG: helix-turn-helix transcriptional regulator [Xanthomonadales bacterium]|nr:helix-turn-helix transcriptional regulator [Xanthomonadales bacterium]